MTSAFSWQNPVSLCLASFCTLRQNLPVTSGISWLPTFAFQSPVMKRTSLLMLVLEALVALHRTVQLQLLQHYWSGHRLGFLWYWMVCLGNEQRSFCHFWDCIQVLLFVLLCWLWWLQGLLELKPKKDVLFIIGDWNANVGSEETPGKSEVSQSCLTLCDPIDCSPPGSSVHGIFPGMNTGVGCHFLLQGIFPTQGIFLTQRSNPHLLHFLYWERILYCWANWVVVAVQLLSHVQLFVTPLTVAHQAPLSMGILQARILEWVAMPSSRGASQLRDQTQVSCIVDRFFTTEPPGKPKNMGVGSLSLLQGIFPIQESNWGLLHCRWILHQLSYQGSPLSPGICSNSCPLSW